MVLHYKTAEEAYAKRQELWRARQGHQRSGGVAPVDRYMFDLQGVRYNI